MKTLQLLGLTLLSVLAPAKAVVIAVMALSMVDLLTGILVSRKHGIPLQSNGLKRTVIKIMCYEVATITAFVVGKYLTGPTLPVMNFVASLIGLTELKSVLENLDMISGGSFFRSLTDKIAGYINHGTPPDAP